MSVSLTWKTDWTAQDNYARNGIEDYERLKNNYIALVTLLAEYDKTATLAAVTLKGYRTLPFAEFLNTTETNLQELKKFSFEYSGEQKTWAGGGTAPTYQDINRWERDGEIIYESLLASKKRQLVCQSTLSEDKTRQVILRGG